MNNNNIKGGWLGKIARVNLSTEEISIHELPDEFAMSYLGGRGFGARILYDETHPGIEPFSPDNLIILATSPLTGTKGPSSSRFSVTTKSPLTGTILDSNCGGKTGLRLKGAGYDALVIKGKADKPVWLLIDETGIKINDASSLWGSDVTITSEKLLEKILFPKDASVACIGPAGENLVRFASIMSDGSRAIGRGGIGAVMGSKNLKAIVTSGKTKPVVVDEDNLDFIAYEAQKALKQSPITSIGLPTYGTASLVKVMNMMGAFPSYNFNDCMFEHVDDVSGETMKERLFIKQRACWGCPIGCTQMTKTKHGEGEGPEYESLWALGPECGIHDIEAIADANYFCNRLGLDTISTGVTIGCAMEMEKRGIVDAGVKFGDAASLLATIENIAYRQNFGNELAEGSRRFAEKYGAPQFAMQVKGMELPAYEPRAMGVQGLAFATSNRGACHLRGNMLGPEILGVPKLVDHSGATGTVGLLIYHQHISAAFDALGVCKFAGFVLSDEHLARMMTAVTGIEFIPQKLHLAGERIWNLEKLYNLREGFARKDDTLPKRLLEEPLKQGPAKGRVVNLNPQLEEYYRFRGWDSKGVPLEAKLKQLGLEA
jgi:aldehyde:ferredoxin oxidoreductase